MSFRIGGTVNPEEMKPTVEPAKNDMEEKKKEREKIVSIRPQPEFKDDPSYFKRRWR